ncbi:MAG: formylglycine-generating enzyme family protein [Gemmatimonadota bacterium]
MRIHDAGIAIRVGGLAAVLLVSGYAVTRFAGSLVDGSGDADIVVPSTPPPGADDPSNRAILIEGGTTARIRDDAGVGGVEVGPRSTADEGRNPLTVAPFWMQEHEVTNEEFRRYDADLRFPIGQERHPVANVTWEDAMAYAASIGGILPTEAQWEFAARGAEGRKYPWGDSEPTCERAQFGGCGPRGSIEVMTRPDGATPEGIHDLAGNVWEWVMPDWFDPGRTPVNDESRRMRGGSFDDEPFYLRGANRSNDFRAGHRYISTGFRVVWPVAGGQD